jgi:hypothetical protein
MRSWRARLRWLVPFTALLGLAGLLLPVPTRAESATACYSAIKAVRTRAKVPAVSSTAQPALARAAQRHATYRVNTAVLGLVDSSAHYETAGRPYYSGVYPWDRTAKAGLKSGSWRRQNEDLTTGVNITAAALAGVQSWIDAPYHRFPLLDANMRDVGCAVAAQTGGSTVHSAEVLEMVWPAGVTQVKTLTVYPAAGQTGVPVAFNRLLEHPTPFGTATSATVGYVATIQAAGYNAMKVSRASLYRGTTSVPVYVAVHAAATSALKPSVDPELPATAAMLAARAPLAGHATYTVKVAGSVRATPTGTWSSFSRSWSFTTA